MIMQRLLGSILQLLEEPGVSRNTSFAHETCSPAPPRPPIHQRLQRDRHIVYIIQPSLLLSMSLTLHSKFVGSVMKYFITLPLLFCLLLLVGLHLAKPIVRYGVCIYLHTRVE